MNCTRCGAENPDRAKFCLECGAPLAAAAPAVEVRKTVTVVFCDVTGSTALGESTDPEAVRGLLARYFERMSGIIEAHGGAVEKFIGDAVMAVFGVPVLHEDDALRAVRAALEMRDALPEIGVQARIGVNTGEVVTGTAERLATGDAVNVAARLEQAALPGEVLLGAQTVQLVRDAVEVEAVEPLQLKGKEQPVEAFRLLALTGREAGARRLEGTFVGRERERRMLREAFDLAVSDQACHLFTMLGVAGVGKSRLAAEFLGEVDATVVRGRCLSYGDGITYWPVVEVVKQLRPDERELEPTVARPLRVLLGSDERATAEEIAFAVRKLLEEAASERPLVVVWDDLHWAEPTFLDLIEHVADWSRAAPILLLCMARPELLDSRTGWAGGSCTPLRCSSSRSGGSRAKRSWTTSAPISSRTSERRSLPRQTATHCSSRRWRRWCATRPPPTCRFHPRSAHSSPRASTSWQRPSGRRSRAGRSRARCSTAPRSPHSREIRRS